MSQYYEKLKNVMTREASKNDNAQAQPRYGLIESYNPANNLVICSLLPEKTTAGGKILTNWLQVVSIMVGPAWGIVSPLEIGDQVIMLPINNSGSEYVVLGASFNDVDTVAQGPDAIGSADTTTQIGEWLLRSKSGTTMKFVAGNTLMIKANSLQEEVLHIITKGTDVDITVSDFIHVHCNTAEVDATSSVTINSPQTIINGHLQVNGSINASQDITDRAQSMAGMRGVYNGHTHDQGDPPDQDMA